MRLSNWPKRQLFRFPLCSVFFFTRYAREHILFVPTDLYDIYRKSESFGNNGVGVGTRGQGDAETGGPASTKKKECTGHARREKRKGGDRRQDKGHKIYFGTYF